MHPLDTTDLFAGLAALDLKGAEVDFGDGITLRSTHARFLTPLTLANTSKTASGAIRPSFWQMSHREHAISAELVIPRAEGQTFKDRVETARFLVMLIRLWSDPAVILNVLSSHAFSTLCDLPDSDRPILIPVEIQPRSFQLGILEPDSVVQSLDWVREHWRAASQLYIESTEFRMAADSLDTGQYVPNHALTLVSLWGALEAIFSPSTTELKFRVSSNIAAYLEPPGQARLALQKRVASLYDMRSAAAHGKPRHASEDLLSSFELVRSVLVQCIYERKVPTKQDLEHKLFGA